MRIHESKSCRARSSNGRFGWQWDHRWRVLVVFAALVATPCVIDVVAGPDETRATIRSAYVAGRMGDAIDAARDLVNALCVEWAGELQASLPPPPAGWSRVDTTVVPPNPDALVSGEFIFSARYTHADGREVNTQLVSVSDDAASPIRAHVLAGAGVDRFRLSSFEGRWGHTGGSAPSQSLVVLLLAGTDLHVDIRGTPGVTREAMLGFATLKSLADMSVYATLRGDAMTPLTGDGPRVDARLAELDVWYSKGQNRLFSIPLRAARAAVAGLAVLRGRRLTDQIRGVPVEWIPDNDPICTVSPTRRDSVFSRWYRMKGESVVVSVCLGAYDDKETQALRPAGIHWEAWVQLPGARGRRRTSIDHSKIEIAAPFPEMSSQFVVFGDGREAVLAAEHVMESNDASEMWTWIREH